jgi:hypothetical protein
MGTAGKNEAGHTAASFVCGQVFTSHNGNDIYPVYDSHGQVVYQGRSYSDAEQWALTAGRNVPYRVFSIEPLPPGDSYTLKCNAVIIGWLHWRVWTHGREGYQYCPNGIGRHRSKVLRSDLFIALTKAVGWKADTARAAIYNARGE